MKWNDYPENHPLESGTYLISVTKPYQGGGDFTFKYVAYYNHKTNVWHKQNLFDENDEVLEVIQHRINGWASNVPIYLR